MTADCNTESPSVNATSPKLSSRYPFSVSMEQSNYYSYQKFRKLGKISRGTLSRIANQAWARFFLELRSLELRNLKEQGLDPEAIFNGNHTD